MKTDLQLGNRVKVHQNTMQTVYMKTSTFSYTVEPPLTDTFQYHIESVVYVCYSAGFWWTTFSWLLWLQSELHPSLFG